MKTDLLLRQFFQDLRALADSAFPKRCANCGRIYETAEQFLANTRNITPDRSGLKSSVNEDGAVIVEAFRNCVCGSTLMDFFGDRRDPSDAGVARREHFGELVRYFVTQGLEHDVARSELLKVLRGERSEILEDFRPPPELK